MTRYLLTSQFLCSSEALVSLLRAVGSVASEYKRFPAYRYARVNASCECFFFSRPEQEITRNGKYESILPHEKYCAHEQRRNVRCDTCVASMCEPIYCSRSVVGSHQLCGARALAMYMHGYTLHMFVLLYISSTYYDAYTVCTVSITSTITDVIRFTVHCTLTSIN